VRRCDTFLVSPEESVVGAALVVFILIGVAVEVVYSFKHAAEEIGRLKVECGELEKDNSWLRRERDQHRAWQAAAIEALARIRRPVTLSFHQPHRYSWPSATSSTNVPHFFMVSRAGLEPATLSLKGWCSTA
jgi:hypothetical protein